MSVLLKKHLHKDSLQGFILANKGVKYQCVVVKPVGLDFLQESKARRK